ncbi:MAG: hydantoinase B/oxoprolinase family protein [bacterium]
MTSPNTTFDPVTLEVAWTRLISIVDEAAVALVRTSFSTVVRESWDFSCVITDSTGQSLAQATDSIPAFIGTLPKTVGHFLAAYPPETLRPGDVLITNDPWQGTGHLPDITVARPIFLEGRLIGFSASTAHSPDIGGKIRSPEAREIYEEGLQIPIMKVIDDGQVNETLFRFLRRNVRTPELTVGDLWAQISALELMQKRVGELMADYGLDSLDGLAAEIQGRCERAMRAGIAALPDGVYRASLLTDGLEQPLTIAMTMTVAGETVAADFSGTSPQVPHAINLPLCYTFAMVAYGLKCVVAPTLPNNGGSIRPITVSAPEGCLVNPHYPASVASRALTGHFIPNLVFHALGEVVPERVMGMVGSPLWSITQSGVDDHGKPYANLFFLNGGMGGNALRDGESTLSWPSNIASTPTEVIEQMAGLRVIHRRLRPGSGGEGRHRGGLGQEFLFENLSEGETTMFLSAERTRIAAPGFGGGKPGATGAVLIDGKLVDPKRQHIVTKGALMELRTPGGGGYGPPEQRDPAAVAHDRAMGYVEPGE